LQSWANALGVDADILFYGCNLAGSSAGKELVDNIARLTGADVAASDDLTGHSLLGGDWVLEYHAGTIEAQPIEALEYKDTLFVVNVDWTSLSYPSGMTQATFSDVGMSGLDVRITLVPDPGLTLISVSDLVLETGQPEALSVSILPSTFGQGVNLMVEYFVTGTTMVVSVGTQVVTVTDIDASVSGSPIQDFQDQVMATASSMNPNSVGVAGSLVFDGSSTVVAMTDAGTSMGALENATFSFTSGSYTGLELFFNDGPGVPTNPSGMPTNHVVGLLGPFSFDAPEVRLIGTPGTQVEGSGSGTMLYVYTVGLTDSMGNGLTSSAPTTVTYSVTGGMTNPADDMSDFSAGTTVIIPANSSTGFFTVTVTEDTVPEFDETFEVMLTGSVFMLGGTTVATGTIINDDSPTISIVNGFSTFEGNAGTVGFPFTVSLSETAPFPITVSFSTTDGTATTGNMDYGSVMQVVSFAPGQSVVVVTVPVFGDTVLELDEEFTVMLSGAMAIGSTVIPSIVNGTQTGTIVNDDTNPALTLLGPATFLETNANSPVPYTVSLSITSGSPVIVTFAVTNGTGGDPTENNDLALFTQTFTIPPGSSTFPISVTISGDAVPEGDENFVVTLTDSNVLTGTLTSTIVNDDALNVSIIGSTSATENAAATTPFSFTISLDKTAEVPVTVSYTTNDGTAMVGDNDYMDNDNIAVFSPGQSLFTVFVTAIDDTMAEPDETFTVNLISITGVGNNQGMLAAPSIATGTIVNDDPSQVSILGLSLAEGTSSNTNFVFTLTLDATNSLPTTVIYSTMDGSATTANQIMITYL
jgi:RNase P/RNase MRP subunit p29